MIADLFFLKPNCAGCSLVSVVGYNRSKSIFSNTFDTFAKRLMGLYCDMSALLFSLKTGVISLVFHRRGNDPLLMQV